MKLGYNVAKRLEKLALNRMKQSLKLTHFKYLGSNGGKIQ